MSSLVFMQYAKKCFQELFIIYIDNLSVIIYYNIKDAHCIL